jgi:hypothetical protein
MQEKFSIYFSGSSSQKKLNIESHHICTNSCTVIKAQFIYIYIWNSLCLTFCPGFCRMIAVIFVLPHAP